MLRSKSQVLYSYLPSSVFRHDSRVYGRVQRVDGSRLTDLNTQVVFEEIAEYVELWPQDARTQLPAPRGDVAREYVLIEPEQVVFNLYPLVFACARRSCARVHVFREASDLERASTCRKCGSRLQQLTFYSVHACGRAERMYVPRCSTHGQEDLFFEDTGSFTTATWRCRGSGCNGGVVSRTNLQPCSCTHLGPDGRARMRAVTLDDSRAFRAHYIDIINIDSLTFRNYQQSPLRTEIALAHYLGTVESLADGLREATQGALTSGARKSPAEWAEQEAKYLRMGLSEAEIAPIRAALGPAETGLAALPEVSDAVMEFASSRPFYERAAVYDLNEVARKTLDDLHTSAVTGGGGIDADSLGSSLALARNIGIEELAVTWEFPIAKIAFGYTREKHEPGESTLVGFRTPQGRGFDGKHPVYAVRTTTEALLVSLSALAVEGFLRHRGQLVTTSANEQDARLRLLGLFAGSSDEEAAAAATVRTLVHTLSHLMLRGLDDGQVGYSEASLSEWLVPETLTFAVYASALKDFTLGSLWTLLSSRSRSWLRGVASRSLRCPNDPLCYQRDPRSCERCSYLTFGCRHRNHDLDRRVVFDFLEHRGVIATLRES